ncbi:MAG: hypothetical protein ACLQNE_31565 [Thermoguttaceae bacterium]
MSEQISSVEGLRDCFRRSILQSVQKCQETRGSYFSRLLRSQTTNTWVDVGPNVQTLPVESTLFLLRGSWQFIIYPHAVGQFETAHAQIATLASTIALAIPQGATVEAAFEFPPTEVSASGERMTCLFKGVVRKHPPEAAT